MVGRRRSRERPRARSGADRYSSRSRSRSRSRSPSQSFTTSTSNDSGRSRSRSSGSRDSSRRRLCGSKQDNYSQPAVNGQAMGSRSAETGRFRDRNARDYSKRSSSRDQHNSRKRRPHSSGANTGGSLDSAHKSSRDRRRSDSHTGSNRRRHKRRRRSRSPSHRRGRRTNRSTSRSYSSNSEDSGDDDLVISATLELELRKGSTNLGFFDWKPKTRLADIVRDGMDRGRPLLGEGIGLTVNFRQQLESGTAAMEAYPLLNDSSVRAAYKRAFKRRANDPSLILRPYLEGVPAPQLKVTAELCVPRGVLQAAATKVDCLQLASRAGRSANRSATPSAAAAGEAVGEEGAAVTVVSDDEDASSPTAAAAAGAPDAVAAAAATHGSRGKARNCFNFSTDQKQHALKEAGFKEKITTSHGCYFADKCTWESDDTTTQRTVECSLCSADSKYRIIKLSDPYQTFLVFRHFGRNHAAELRQAGFSDELIVSLAAPDNKAVAEKGPVGNRSATGSSQAAAAAATAATAASGRSKKADKRAAGQRSITDMWSRSRLTAGSLAAAQQHCMQQAAADEGQHEQPAQRDETIGDPGEFVRVTVDLSDMHEDLLLLHVLLKGGALRPDHVAWQALRYLARSSLGMVTPGQELSSEYNNLLEFMMTLRSVGGASAVCLFNGVGGVGLGRGAELLPHQFWQNHNFGNVSLRTIAAKQPDPNLKGGPDIAALLRALYTLQESHTRSRSDSQGLTVIFCTLAADGGTLAPAVQYYGSGVSACLAAADGELEATLVTTADIRKWRQLQQDGKEAEVVAQLQGRLPAVAINFIVSPLDASFSSQLPQPYVGCIYAAAEGSFESVNQRMDKAAQVFSMCTNCLSKKLKEPGTDVQCDTSCADCVVVEGDACDQCARMYHNPAAALRPCRSCKQAGLHCVRLDLLMNGMDNDSKQLKQMQLQQQRSCTTLQQWSLGSSGHQTPATTTAAEAAATAAADSSNEDDGSDSDTEQQLPACLRFLTGIPDCPHVIKIIRAGAHHWWLLIDGHLACVRMLHALRNDPDPVITRTFRPVISAAAVRNKDAMNLQTALELGNPKLRQALTGAGDTYVANTLVPEQLMKWDKNPRNSKMWPVDCCIHPVGIMFVTDAEKPIVRQVQLHCPANVTPIGGGDSPGSANGPSSRARFGKLGGIIVLGSYLLVVDRGNKQLRVANIRRVIFPGGGLLVTAEEDDSATSETAAAAPSGTSSSTAGQSSSKTSVFWGTVQLVSPTGGPVRLNKPYAITGPWDSAIITAGEWRTSIVAAGTAVYVSDESSDGTCSILRISGLQEQHSAAAAASAAAKAALSLVVSATAKPLRCNQSLQRITGLALLADKKHLVAVAAEQVWLLRVDGDPCAATALCSIVGAHGVAASADGALFVSSTELYNIKQLTPATGYTWQHLLRHSMTARRQQGGPEVDSNLSLDTARPAGSIVAGLVVATAFAGSAERVRGAADGTAATALLTSPAGLATYHRNLLVCDQGIGPTCQSNSANSCQEQRGRLVLLSHTKPLVWLSEMVEQLATAFGMRCDKTVKPGNTSSWQQAITLLEQVEAMMQDHKKQLIGRTGRPGGQGPELALSHVSRQSVSLMLNAMKQVHLYLRLTLSQQEFSRIDAALSPSAVCTLVVENFVAITRKHNANPSALNHAQLVPTVARELSKRICASFSYYTGGKQHYNFAQQAGACNDSASSSSSSGSSSRLLERLQEVDELVNKLSTTTRALAASANSSLEEQQQIKQRYEEEDQLHIQFLQEFCKACRQEPVRAAHTREVRGRDPYGISHRQPHCVISAAPTTAAATAAVAADPAGAPTATAASDAAVATSDMTLGPGAGHQAGATNGMPPDGAAAGNLLQDNNCDTGTDDPAMEPTHQQEQQQQQQQQQPPPQQQQQQPQQQDDGAATARMGQGLQQLARRSNRQAERQSMQQQQQQQEGHRDSQQLRQLQHQQPPQQRKKLQGQQTKQQQKQKPKKQSKAAACGTRGRKQQQDEEQQPGGQDTVVEAEQAVAAIDSDDQRETAFHPALFSITGRPLPVQPVSELGDGILAKYRYGQVVAVVLPPDAASVPLALVELLEDVVYTREGDSEVFVKGSFRGCELEEMASEMHHYVRVTGECRVAGNNIARAVRVSKFLFHKNAEQQHMAYVLEADEWDSLALMTLGEV